MNNPECATPTEPHQYIVAQSVLRGHFGREKVGSVQFPGI
jgi:hypothetical protein